MGLNASQPAPTTAIAHLLGHRRPIIYGAGSAGRHLLKLFDALGVEVAGCVDAHAERIGALGAMPVHPPERLGRIANPQAHALIVAINAEHVFDAVSAQLAAQYPAFGTPLRARDVAASLAEARCQRRLDGGGALDLGDCMGCRPDIGACPAFRRGAERAGTPAPRPVGAGAGINDFAYFITNRCTLNCTHCVEALPHYEQHYNDSVDDVLAAVAKLVAASGFVHRLSITGGEILLHRDLPAILDGLLAMPGIGYIFPYTSGTVTPGPALLARLAHPRIALNVSDYGEHTPPRLRENFDAFIAALERGKVAHTVLTNKVWLDMGHFEDLHLDPAAMRASFAKCVFTNCMTVSRNVLYRCPHQLAGVQQGRLPAAADQCVDLNALSGDALTEALNRFARLDYIDACGHCKLSDSPREVPAALQSPRRRTIRLAVDRAAPRPTRGAP